MIERTSVPMPTRADLDRLYAEHNDAKHWREHRARIAITVELARYRFGDGLGLVVDPAAGGNYIAPNLGARTAITGDLAATAPVLYPGRDAVSLLDDIPHGAADLVILSEILEHLPEPGIVLDLTRLALRRDGGLVVTTPCDEPDGVNPEHLWRWDRAGIVELLERHGFTPVDYLETGFVVDGWPVPFRIQMHTARRIR